MNFIAERTLLVVLTLVALSVSGCGTGDYNAALANRLEELKRDAPFLALTAPTEIPGTSVSLCLPKMLPRYVTPETADAGGLNGKISAERVKFLPLKLPGVYCAYDGEDAMPDGSKVPMACQIAIIPKTAPDAQQLSALVEAGLKVVLPNAKPVWESIEVDAPKGEKKVPWRRMSIEGDLNFDVTPAGGNAQAQFKALPANVEIWWHESDPYHTLLVWRIPKDLNDKIKLTDLAALSASTISVAPPPDPKQPDAAAN